MKLFLVVIGFILNSSLAFADFSKLGNLTEYICIVEIENGFADNGGEADSLAFNVYQTCDESSKRELITQIFDANDPTITSLANIQIKVIKTMRNSFKLISSTETDNKTTMVFRKD